MKEENGLGWARGYLYRRKSQKALEELRAVEDRYGRSEDSIELTAKAYQLYGDYRALARYARELLFAYGNRHQVGWSLVIYAHVKSGQMQAALNSAGQALGYYSDSAIVLFEVSRFFVAIGDFEAASECLDRAFVRDASLQYRYDVDPDFLALREWLEMES